MRLAGRLSRLARGVVGSAWKEGPARALASWAESGPATPLLFSSFPFSFSFLSLADGSGPHVSITFLPSSLRFLCLLPPAADGDDCSGNSPLGGGAKARRHGGIRLACLGTLVWRISGLLDLDGSDSGRWQGCLHGVSLLQAATSFFQGGGGTEARTEARATRPGRKRLKPATTRPAWRSRVPRRGQGEARRRQMARSRGEGKVRATGGRLTRAERGACACTSAAQRYGGQGRARLVRAKVWRWGSA